VNAAIPTPGPRFQVSRLYPFTLDVHDAGEPSLRDVKNGRSGLSFATRLFFFLRLYVLFLRVGLQLTTRSTYFASFLHYG
jgi:hypothetical protein